MGLRERNAHSLELPAGAAQLAGTSGFGQTVKDIFGKEFGGGVGTLEIWRFVEIAIIQRRQHGPQGVVCAAYVNDNAVAVESLRDEGRVDNECRPVQLLCGPEHRAVEGMSNHDVVANFNREQGGGSLRVGDGLAEYPASGVKDSRESFGQVMKTDRRSEQRVKSRIIEQSSRRSEAAAMRPARPVRRRDLSYLARDQSKPAAMEGASKPRGHSHITIPTHLKHGCLFACQFNCRAQTICGTTGMKDEVTVAFCLRRSCETNPDRLR